MAFTGGESLRKVKNTEIVHGRHCALLSNNDRFAVIAGFRYNNLSGAIRGPGILPSPRIPTGHQEWGDPSLAAMSGFLLQAI
jgi:hypothetical protein